MVENNISKTRIITYLIIALLFVVPGSFPWDTHSYLHTGKCFIELTQNKIGCFFDTYESYFSVYGPITGLIYGIHYIIFGNNYYTTKIISLIFYMLTASQIKNTVHKKIFYTSFIPMYMLLIRGDEEYISIFFLLAATSKILKKEYFISNIYLILSVLTKPTPLIALPAILFYIYNKKGTLYTINYLLMFSVFSCLVFISWVYLLEDIGVRSYVMADTFDGGYSIYNFIKYCFGLTFITNIYTIVLAFFFKLISFFICIYYLVLNKDSLYKNIGFSFLCVFAFMKVGDPGYYIWFWLYLILTDYINFDNLLKVIIVFSFFFYYVPLGGYYLSLLKYMVDYFLCFFASYFYIKNIYVLFMDRLKE